ncbi:DUF4336 domain-containing protein [Roseovarius salinarum]|uniref:DUF4336 domain-containing protein n=1 Tax=Roseovarius salinarum TaxID=1981892 RepID=UPI000C32EB3F|nr:DUF4336 domain-containing protein [Roseovarius salinarum]
MDRPTGYEPLNTLKPFADDIWIVDGPAIRFYGLPFSTRATVVRLASGALWVHSPTRLTAGLQGELSALGPVAHLVAPNWIHYANLPDWQAAFPRATAWAAPGVAERAASKGLTLQVDHALRPDRAEDPWAGEIDQIIVQGSAVHREAVFFHRASATLILTDLIENFETAKLPAWMRPVVWLAGIDDHDGKMPPDMRWTFRKGKQALIDSVETMIGWGPERIILAHGRYYERRAVDELERAFRFVLSDKRWMEAVRDMEELRNRR